MTRRISLVVATSALLLAGSASAEPLPGSIDSGAGSNNIWQSSWLNLTPQVSFRKGEKLRIAVQGSAKKVLVRLLPADSSPSSSDGVEGNIRKVPADGVLDVTLTRDHPSVKQVSVHAGKEAWGRPLGVDNGTIRLISVERTVPQ